MEMKRFRAELCDDVLLVLVSLLTCFSLMLIQTEEIGKCYSLLQCEYAGLHACLR